MSEYSMLRIDCDSYRLFDHDKPVEYGKKMRSLFDIEDNVGDFWEKATLKLFEGEPGKQNLESKKQIPDIIHGIVSIALNQKTRNILSPLINNYVEYLTLDSENGIYYEINVKKINCLDKENSKIIYFSSGKIMEVETYKIKWELVKNAPIFCITDVGSLPIFVNNEFKKIILKNGLTGLLFLPIPSC